MIVGIEGNIGSGKTLVATYFALKEYTECKRTLYANYHLKQIPFRFIAFQDAIVLMNGDHEFRDTTLLVDEAHMWADSRTSTSATNRLFSYLVAQTGKEDTNLYYTTQDFGMVDRRLRNRTDIGIYVRRKGNRHLLKVYDRMADRSYNAIVYGPDVWEYFDTREKVTVAHRPKLKT